MAKIEQVKNKRHEIIHPITSVPAIEGLEETLAGKQETLVSGSNIKKVNGHDLLGSGNINITGSGDVIVIDDAMSAYSENPVQNKVISAALNNLLSMIQAVEQFRYESVDTLPDPPSAETMGIIYLIPASLPDVGNIKDEFITIRTGEEGDYTYSWEKIGSTAVDLSDYATDAEVQADIAAALSAYIRNVTATVDANIGTPSVTTSFDAGVLTLEFHNLKGQPGPVGVTAVTATVDNNTGVPEVTATLLDQVLTLAFRNLKGDVGTGIYSVTSAQDGTAVITLTSGDTVTLDLNHNHPQYPKYVVCDDEQEYEDISNKDSGTLYLILE